MASADTLATHFREVMGRPTKELYFVAGLLLINATTMCCFFDTKTRPSTGLPGPPIYFFGAIFIASIRWQ
ncbi:MAG: hypothetical protein K9M08_07815 [Pirellula sp.]|nr:hypothetical protein [Pirellula sp.]